MIQDIHLYKEQAITFLGWLALLLVILPCVLLMLGPKKYMEHYLGLIALAAVSLAVASVIRQEYATAVAAAIAVAVLIYEIKILKK